jgi:hypothetical protein
MAHTNLSKLFRGMIILGIVYRTQTHCVCNIHRDFIAEAGGRWLLTVKTIAHNSCVCVWFTWQTASPSVHATISRLGKEFYPYDLFTLCCWWNMMQPNDNWIVQVFSVRTTAYHQQRSKVVNDEYLLTPWSRVLLEKLPGSVASQEISRIFGTRRFYTIHTSVRHPSLSWANSLPLPEDCRNTPWNILVRICTYSMEQSPSWEANWFCS